METVINGASNKKSKKKDKEQGVKRKGSPQVSPNVTPKKKSKKDDVSISVSLNKYNQKPSDEIPQQQKLTKKEKKRLLDRKVLSNDGKMNETAHQEKVTKNKKKRLLNNHVLSGDGKLNDIAKSRKDKKKKKKNKNKNRLLDHHHETAQPKQVTKNKKRLLDVHKMLSRDGEVNEIQHTKEVPKMKILDETVVSAESITEFEELHLASLIKNISKNIPPNDRLMFKLRARTIDWQKVAFKRYSAKLCRDVWYTIQGHLRQNRTLAELLNEAKEWTNTEWKENLKPKIHPNFPRRPLTIAYLLYLSEAKNLILSINPNLDDVAINKLAKKVYATLEPEKIECYEKAAAENKKKYEEAVEAFYEYHPDVRKKKKVQSLIQQNQTISPIKQNQIKPNKSSVKYKQVANIIKPNKIMNPINENKVIPISKNQVVSPVTPNEVVGPIKENQVVSPIKENQVVSPIKENQVVSPMKKNEVVRFIKQNSSEISPVKQKQAFIKPIQATLPLKYNKAVNVTKQNLSVTPIKLKQPLNSIEQNQAIHYVTQNQTVGPIKQNATVVSPIQQKQVENIKQNQSVSPIKEMQIVSPIKQNQSNFIKLNKVVTPIKKDLVVSPITQAINQIEEKWALTFSKENQVATPIRHNHAVNKSFNPINRNQSLIDQHQANKDVNSMKLNQIDNPIKQSQVVSPIKQIQVSPIIQNQAQHVNLNPVNQYQVISPVNQNQVISFDQQVSEVKQTINDIMHKQSVSPIKQNQAVNPIKQNQAVNPIKQKQATLTLPLYFNNGKPVKLRNLTTKFIKPKNLNSINQNKATSFVNQNSIGKKVDSEINPNRTAKVIKKNEHAIPINQNAVTLSKKQIDGISLTNQNPTANSKALSPVNQNLSNEKIDDLNSNEQLSDINSFPHIENVNSMKENLEISSKNQIDNVSSIEHNQTVNSTESSINERVQLANTISQISAANYSNKQDKVVNDTNNNNRFSYNVSFIKQNEDAVSIQQIENINSIEQCNDVGAIVEISDESSFEQIGEVSAVKQSSTQQNLNWYRNEREQLINTISKILAEHVFKKPIPSTDQVQPESSTQNNAVANSIKPTLSEQNKTISQNQHATSSFVDTSSTDKELCSKKQDETVTSTNRVAKSTRTAGIRIQQKRPVFYKKRNKNTNRTATNFINQMSTLSSSTQKFVNSFMQNMTVYNDAHSTEQVETIKTIKKNVAMNFNKPGCSNEGDETTSQSRGAGFRNKNKFSGHQSRIDNYFMRDDLAMGKVQNLSSPRGPALSNKAVSSMWINDKCKQMGQPHQEEEEVDDEEMGVAETYEDYMPSKLKLGRKHPDPVVETASLSSVAPADIRYTLSIPEQTIKGGHLSALQLESITYASQAHEHILPDGSRAGFLIGDGAGVGKGRTIAGVIYENYLKGRKRAIWVSVSNDLKYDAERDLKDIGAGKVEVHALNKFKYAKISSAINNNVKQGVVFSTYSALIGESNSAKEKYKTRLKQLLQWCGPDFDGLIIFDECHRAKNLCPIGSSKPTKTGLTVLELQNKLPKARVVYASATGASEPRNMAYMVRLGLWGEGSPFKEFNDFISAVEKRGVGVMEIVAMDMKLRGMYIARQLSFQGVSYKIEEVPLPKEFERIYDASVKLWVEAMQKFHEAAELIYAENRMRKTMWGQFWSSHQRFFKYLCIAAKVPRAVATAHEAIKMGKCVVIGLQSTGEAGTLEQLERDDGELTDFVSTAKGVFQTLVEKHFPAHDIQRLLGIEAPTNAKKSTNGNDEVHTLSRKRKTVKQAAARAVKRNKRSTSDNDKSDSERSSAGSEFKMTDGESEICEVRSDSTQSSDFNLFNSDGDSDNDPWSRSKKKGKKVKKLKKNRPSTTQDKISLLLVQKTQTSKSNGGHLKNTPSYAPPRDAIERAITMKEELLQQIERLGDKLPPNTLDQLIDELGGPENVAEMTGRKGRVVQTEHGIQYESRCEADVPLETLNVTEKQRFMDGKKKVAIISEAASSGISLQSDRRVKNQRRRVHITLELPWSADSAIQQFGRTHRSNQVNAPEYIFLISDLAGERRFASTVAKRLESLGALTHGDRRATETCDLSQFNIDNKYGRTALEKTMKTIMGYMSPLVPPPQDYEGDFFKDAAAALVGVGIIVNSKSTPGVLSLDKDYNNMSKFLNRILGMPVNLQNRLFRYFKDTLAEIITQAKRSGRFDLGILDLGAGGENVKRVKTVTFLRKHATGTAPTELHTVHVEKGMSWAEVIDKWANLAGIDEGFYLSHQVRNNKHTAILAVCVDSGNKKKAESKKEQMYFVYRPNTGLQFRQESLAELEKKYKMVLPDEAQEAWNSQYDSLLTNCSHVYWRGNCRNVNLGHDCEVGLRRRTYHVVSGSVLSVWARVEGVLASRNSSDNNKMQVIRLRTADGLKIVGTLIPKNCVESLTEALSADAEKVEEKTI